MKILFIGGTGIISSASSQLVVDRGHELYLLNRGQTSTRPAPKGAKLLVGDIRNAASANKAIGSLTFDAVVNWVNFTPDQVQADINLFSGKTKQYVFISSASAYHTPPRSLPVTESTPLHNPFWQYSRDKIACEELLLSAYRKAGFPMTIVRPSHTYDKTLFPFHGGWTVVDRMRKGKKVVVHGDGTSLWTFTHHRDFAVGFVGLLGNPAALGEAYHITNDEWLSWNQIHEITAQAAGCEAKLVHVTSDEIARLDPDWGAGLHGDKAHSMIFDNSKIRRLVPEYNPVIPFARGIEEILAWYDGDAARRIVDPHVDQLMDEMIKAAK